MPSVRQEHCLSGPDVCRNCPCRLITDVDLHVGATIPILQRKFELLDADEFTLQYMENNRQVYSMADAEKALQALATAVKAGADTF